VVHCEDWLWSSAAERSRVLLLDPGPIPKPSDWLRIVNRSVDGSPAPPDQDRIGLSSATTALAPGHSVV
jgi:hypothetical protein